MPSAPSDFEVYVRRQSQGLPVSRLGSDAIARLQADPSSLLQESNPLVPPDYLLRPGDELVISMWGSIDADLRLTIDRSGRVQIPRVGPVMLSGVRYADAPDVLSRRVAQVFRNFQLSVTLGQLRGIRVYVTGFVARPGLLNVNALASVPQALFAAGGPLASGSYRQIELRRGNAVVGRYDLYRLLVDGERGSDQVLQSDDVIHVPAVGPQVAIIGAVNRSAVIELKPGETIGDLLRLAGGLSPVADPNRLALDRLRDRAEGRVVTVSLPDGMKMQPQNGDVLRAFNLADVMLPSERLNKRVRIDGEVVRPGEYILPPDSTLADLIDAAGGLTSRAFLFASQFTRESVRRSQQENYERALRDLETQFATHNATRRTSTAEEAMVQGASATAIGRFIEQLRSVKPTGRVVLQLTTTSATLPELVLEEGDQLSIPAKPTTVGVFGSVFSAGSYLHSPNRTIGDYLRLAGGPTRGADSGSVFVIRANGMVHSSLQNASFLSRGNQISPLPAEAGDTIFVPEEMDKATWIQNAKDWTQILYQFGIGLAGIRSATN